MKTDADLTPFTKITSKWIGDPNVNHKAVKLKEENIGENPDDLGYDDELLDS